ncbi:MAG TPA: hypothetical protein VK190_03485 [Pseudoneobacillus sp.]|nr:hypothetical protein [Pseudoneobacillus sp.]
MKKKIVLILILLVLLTACGSIKIVYGEPSVVNWSGPYQVVGLTGDNYGTYLTYLDGNGTFHGIPLKNVTVQVQFKHIEDSFIYVAPKDKDNYQGIIK